MKRVDLHMDSLIYLSLKQSKKINESVHENIKMRYELRDH